MHGTGSLVARLSLDDPFSTLRVGGGMLRRARVPVDVSVSSGVAPRASAPASVGCGAKGMRRRRAALRSTPRAPLLPSIRPTTKTTRRWVVNITVSIKLII